MSSKQSIQYWVFILLFSFLLVSCQSGPEPSPTQNQPTETIEMNTVPVPSPTVPPRELTICLGQEPQTLYMYGGSTKSMWSVLESVYDGPFDTRSFEIQPVILEKLPSLNDGDAVIQPVDVRAGDSIVDTNGDLVALKAGTQLRPTGCRSSECAVAWDGSSPLQMDQMVVRYKLLPDITWSDGTPLTAADSVFSYSIASDSATPVSKYNVYRTFSYQTLDNLSVEWVGQPGFLPIRYETFFWSPLPRHALEGIQPADMLTNEVTTKKPMGWGPYIIQEWVAGDHITLQKNPNYFRSEEGLPQFDTLEYRFLGIHADGNLAAVLDGTCDLVDDTADLVEQLEPIIEQSRAGKVSYYIGQGPEWEQVSFGIRPATYDDGYNPYAGERPDFFSDVRVRKAFAYCMDRPWAITDILIDESIVPASYLPPSHPLYLSDLSPLPFDVEEGKRLLDEAGWVDLDGNPDTPRQAYGVPGVFDGTPLEVSYATTQATQRMEVAQILVDSLKECGIQANLQSYSPGELFAPGPNGIVFGRQFDLVHFGWDVGSIPPCSFYSTGQIPTSGNNWIGVNITGYSNPEYDALCQAANDSRPEDGDSYIQNQYAVQRFFADELPVVPLYFRLKMAMSRPDFCGMDMDVTARSALWNIEAFNFGENCSQ